MSASIVGLEMFYVYRERKEYLTLRCAYNECCKPSRLSLSPCKTAQISLHWPAISALVYFPVPSAMLSSNVLVRLSHEYVLQLRITKLLWSRKLGEVHNMIRENPIILYARLTLHNITFLNSLCCTENDSRNTRRLTSTMCLVQCTMHSAQLIYQTFLFSYVFRYSRRRYGNDQTHGK